MGLNTIWTKNPQGASAALYVNTRIERAPDAAGAPGAFAGIATFAFDVNDEVTGYLDTAGAATDWYRYRWENAAATSNSDWDSTGKQVGTNKVKTSLKLNIPDADLLDPYWDDWIEFSLIELYSKGIWKLDYVDIVPTTVTPGVVDTVYGLPSKIRDIIKVEERYTTSGNPVRATLDDGEYDKQDRKVWLPNAATSYIYRVWGKARFNAVGEMTDDFFKLLYDMVRVRYFEFRENGRGNYRAYIILDRNADISPEQLSRFRQEAEQKVAAAVSALSLGEPAIQVPSGGYW